MHTHVHVPVLYPAGPFPEPCNTAQPSPCARYIAVLIDAPVVYVLLRADDFSLGRAKRLPFLLDRPPSWADRSWVSANVVYGRHDLVCGVRRIIMQLLHPQAGLPRKNV